MTWPKVILTIAGCAVGGFGLGVLIAAVLGRRVWESATN